MTGDELKSLRREAGLRGHELAAEIGYSKVSWSNFERGHRQIPKAVELAARYVCEKRINRPTAERLVEILREVVRV